MRHQGSQKKRGLGQEVSFEAEAESEVDPFNLFPEPIRLEILDVFDLHTIAPRDVKRVVEEYLMEAHAAGYKSVRIIHGKGKGVQREMVRSILARTPFVEAWTDAPLGGGGWGATIVRFTSEDSRKATERGGAPA
ncbi:MAG TPA: Smr/MutS family protein [Pyrinomonadaceae bacterium]